MRQLWAIILVAQVCVASFAQHVNDLDKSISLESLVQQALLRSDQMIAQRARVGERHEEALQAPAWDNPSINFSAGAKFAPPEVGPLFQVGISQLFFFPGKQRLRKEILDFETTVEENHLNETELAITMDVIRLAYEYAINQKKAQFADSRRKRFELIEAYLAGHTFASPQQKATSLIVRERLRNVGVDKDRLQGALQATFEQLNFYLAQESSNIPLIDVPWLEGKHDLDKRHWIAKTLSNNLDLAEERTENIQAVKEKALFAREVWPDLSVSAFYGQETAGETDRIVGLGLSLPIPLLNQNRHAIRGKEYKINAEKAQLAMEERKINSLIRKLLAEYDAGQKIVVKYPLSTIAMLESQLQVMEKEFRKNRVDFLLFVELDIQAAETVNRVLDAQLSFVDTIASMHFLARDRSIVKELSAF